MPAVRVVVVVVVGPVEGLLPVAAPVRAGALPVPRGPILFLRGGPEAAQRRCGSPASLNVIRLRSTEALWSIYSRNPPQTRPRDAVVPTLFVLPTSSPNNTSLHASLPRPQYAGPPGSEPLSPLPFLLLERPLWETLSERGDDPPRTLLDGRSLDL